MRKQVTFAAVAAMLAMGMGLDSSPVRVTAASGPSAGQQNLQELFSIFHGRRPRGERITANLQSETEVPSISSLAHGRFEAEIDDDNVEYELSFEALQGVVTQSHIHIAQPNVNGGIMVWLCNTATNPGPASFTGPACPAAPGGTVTGIIKATDVLAVTAQGIAAGEFGEFVTALKKELAYVNVHSSLFTGGEIRGQVNRKGR
jgi:CHRD domain-containing protein